MRFFIISIFSFDPEVVHESVLSALRFLSQQEVMKAHPVEDDSEPPSLSAIAAYARFPDSMEDDEKKTPMEKKKPKGIVEKKELVLPPALSAYGGLEWLRKISE